MSIHLTRESWLTAALRLVDLEVFEAAGHPRVPRTTRVSMGWGSTRKVIGECHHPANSETGHTELFISPVLADPHTVLATLVHEMVHAVVGTEHKHKKPFKDLARAVGLEGRLTATYVSVDSALGRHLADLAERLGEYPHSALRRIEKKRGAQGGWRRLQSLNRDSYKVLISPAQLEEHGYPLDPWGDEMVEVQS